MDCMSPTRFLCGIFQTRILERVAISFTRGSYWPRDWIRVSSICRWILYRWATWEACVAHLLFQSTFLEHLLCASCCYPVTKSCPTLCDLMDCSTPGSSVLHCLPEFTQTRVHWVSDAIQPSHPLPSPSPPALSPSQHQGLFQRAGSSHQVVKVLEFQLQGTMLIWWAEQRFALSDFLILLWGFTQETRSRVPLLFRVFISIWGFGHHFRLYQRTKYRALALAPTASASLWRLSHCHLMSLPFRESWSWIRLSEWDMICEE